MSEHHHIPPDSWGDEEEGKGRGWGGGGRRREMNRAGERMSSTAVVWSRETREGRRDGDDERDGKTVRKVTRQRKEVVCVCVWPRSLWTQYPLYPAGRWTVAKGNLCVVV